MTRLLALLVLCLIIAGCGGSVSTQQAHMTGEQLDGPPPAPVWYVAK